MVAVYAFLIKKGLKTIEDVPDNIRQDVINLLEGE